MADRHKKPRLAPLSIEQEHHDKLMAISEKVGLPPAWVHRKLLVEALEDVDMDTLPIVFTRKG